MGRRGPRIKMSRGGDGRVGAMNGECVRRSQNRDAVGARAVPAVGWGGARDQVRSGRITSALGAALAAITSRGHADEARERAVERGLVGVAAAVGDLRQRQLFGGEHLARGVDA